MPEAAASAITTSADARMRAAGSLLPWELRNPARVLQEMARDRPFEAGQLRLALVFKPSTVCRLVHQTLVTSDSAGLSRPMPADLAPMYGEGTYDRRFGDRVYEEVDEEVYEEMFTARLYSDDLYGERICGEDSYGDDVYGDDVYGDDEHRRRRLLESAVRRLEPDYLDQKRTQDTWLVVVSSRYGRVILGWRELVWDNDLRFCWTGLLAATSPLLITEYGWAAGVDPGDVGKRSAGLRPHLRRATRRARR